MADLMDKIGQAGQGTIDVVKPAKQKPDGAKKDESDGKENTQLCGPSDCSNDQLKEQQKSKMG